MGHCIPCIITLSHTGTRMGPHGTLYPLYHHPVTYRQNVLRQNVPRQNVLRHKVLRTKRPKRQNVPRTKCPKDKTSQVTKRPEGQKCPERQIVPRDKTSYIVLFSILAVCFIMLHFFRLFLEIKILFFSIFPCRSRWELCQKTRRKPGGPSSSGQLGGAYTIVHYGTGIVHCTVC